MDVIHTQIECRSAGVSVWWGYWLGCSRIVYVANLSGKELVKLLLVGTDVILSLFFPGLSKTSFIGDSL